MSLPLVMTILVNLTDDCYSLLASIVVALLIQLIGTGLICLGHKALLRQAG